MKDNESWKKLIKENLNHFYKIDDAEWNEILNHFQLIKIKRKEYFARPGEKSKKIGLIIRGLLRTYILTEEGEEKTTDFCTAGDFTASFNYFQSNHDIPQWIEALEETEIGIINYDLLEKIISEKAHWQLLFRKIMEEYYSMKSSREIELLSLDAARRYQEFLKNHPDFSERISQYHIASYLGITPVSLSRIRKELGII